MHTKVMTWLSIAALLATMTFWNSAPTFQLELNLIVCLAAVVIFIQAFRARRFRWATGFLVMALLFNPALPVFRLVGGVSLLLVVLSITVFGISLVALKPHPLLSMPSITDRNPGSQSL